MSGSNNKHMSDSEIVSAISCRQWLVRFLLLLVFVFAVGGIGIIYLGIGVYNKDFGTEALLVVVGFVCMFMCYPAAKWREKAVRNLKALEGEYVVKAILAERVEISEYSPNKYIGKKFVDNCAILPYYDKISGSDYVAGKYRGVWFRFSDLLLEYEKTCRNSNGKTSKQLVTIFQGQVIHMELGKNIGGYVSIRERRDTGRKKSLTSKAVGGLVNGILNVVNQDKSENIETENAEFNSKFKINTSDGQLAFYILTPQFMESAMRLDALAGGYTNISFSGSGVTITLNNNRDSFEMKHQLVSSRQLERYRQRFRDEFTVILEIFDEILTKENLFN